MVVAAHSMIELAQARLLIAQRLAGCTLATESVPLDHALGRVLAQTLIAPFNVPGFVHSAMDGYALRHADLKPETPTRLREVAVQLAGRASRFELLSGQCARITTGAPLPDGADTVVIKEHAQRNGGDIELAPGTARGANVRAADDDYAAGTIAMPAGTRIRPAHLGVAAEFGLTRIEVRRRPRVAILVTGDELVPGGGACGYGQRYESNGAALSALVAEHSGEVVMRRHVPDDPVAVAHALASAASAADLILSSGGVSAGEADFLPEEIGKLGSVVFWKVRMRPGMPVLFGDVDGVPVFALPGNPVSVYATFIALVRSAFAALTACVELDPAPLFARLIEPVEKRHRRLELRRARLHCAADGRLMATAHPLLSSGALKSVAESDVLIELDAERERFEPTDVVPVHRIALI